SGVPGFRGYQRSQFSTYQNKYLRLVNSHLLIFCYSQVAHMNKNTALRSTGNKENNIQPEEQSIWFAPRFLQFMVVKYRQ
ncbi:hypothetical protein BSK54_01655, partial [Paenibacillus odorifer]